MAPRITSRTVLAGAAGIFSLALVAGTTTAAYADSFRHTDATGDVVGTLTGAPDLTQVFPSQKVPDLQNLTVEHSRWTVSVATALRGLEGAFTRWTATIVTSTGERFDVNRFGSGEYPRMTVSYNIAHNGYGIKCDGLIVSRTSSGVIAKVPTRCLGNPWKVRVGVLAHAERSDGAEPHWSDHDDVLRNGAFTYRKPALSPWIAR